MLPTLCSTWRRHSCLPRRDSSRRSCSTRVETSLDLAGKSACATLVFLAERLWSLRGRSGLEALAPAAT